MLPKSTYEQRRRFYSDIEDLINVGFLTQKIEIGDSTLCLRSLGPGDQTLLSYRVNKKQNWDLWAVATSLWMVNGVSSLSEPQTIPVLHNQIKKLPRALRNWLVNIVVTLYDRQRRANAGAEAFCYETSARMLWRLLGRRDFKSHLGIPGTEQLGLNYVQQIWMAFNELEDIKQHDDQMWEGFKLVATTQAPKGVKKLDQHDKQRRELEETRRQQVMDQFFYRGLGIVSEDGKDLSGGQLIKMPVTEEDLREEMRKWVAGEKDEHDQIVENYKRTVTERYHQERRAREERVLMLRQHADQEETPSDRPLVGYTADQLQAILSTRQTGRPAGARTVFEGGKDQDYLYNKYLSDVPTSGRLQVQQGQLTTDEDSKTLSQKIAERLVTYKNKTEEE